MISNRNDIFRCLIIGSCLFIFWGVIIIWIASYQNLYHALYLTLYFSKYSGVTIIWNSTHLIPWDVLTNWNMSSNWHQRVQENRQNDLGNVQILQESKYLLAFGSIVTDWKWNSWGGAGGSGIASWKQCVYARTINKLCSIRPSSSIVFASPPIKR